MIDGVLASKGIIGGYTDGTFRPNNNISRAEVAKMVCIAIGWELKAPATPSFSDVAKDNWAYMYVETAKAHGVLNGYKDGSFGPNKRVYQGNYF